MFLSVINDNGRKSDRILFGANCDGRKSDRILFGAIARNGSQAGFPLAQLRRTKVRLNSLWRNCAERKSDRIPFVAIATSGGFAAAAHLLLPRLPPSCRPSSRGTSGRVETSADKRNDPQSTLSCSVLQDCLSPEKHRICNCHYLTHLTL
jgi:hypothetical protein